MIKGSGQRSALTGKFEKLSRDQYIGASKRMYPEFDEACAPFSLCPPQICKPVDAYVLQNLEGIVQNRSAAMHCDAHHGRRLAFASGDERGRFHGV